MKSVSWLPVLLVVACGRPAAGPPPPPDMVRTVVVLAPANHTGDPLLVAGTSFLEKYALRSDRITVPDVLASEARLQLARRGFTIVPSDEVERATGGRAPGSPEAAAEIASRAKLSGLALYLDIRRWEPDAPTHPAFVVVGLTASLVDPATGRVVWTAKRPTGPVPTPGEVALGPAYVTAARKVMEEVLAPLGPTTDRVGLYSAQSVATAGLPGVGDAQPAAIDGRVKAKSLPPFTGLPPSRKRPATIGAYPPCMVNADTDALLRELIFDHLGVLPEELSPDVSLVDDLAVDSLDLCEVGLAIEDRLGVVLPRHAMEEVRTYGDLLSTALHALDPGQRPSNRHTPPFLTARLVSPGQARGRTFRAATFSHYEVELIVDDALRAGAGARLAVELTGVLDSSVCNSLRVRLAGLTARGIQVHVRCDREGCRHGTSRVAASSAPLVS